MTQRLDCGPKWLVATQPEIVAFADEGVATAGTLLPRGQSPKTVGHLNPGVLTMLSQTTGYATLALGCIESAKGRRVTSKQIRDCSGVPMAYLRKILHALGKAGLVQTKRGHQGGFVLTRPAGQITLMDVAEAVEGKKQASYCLFGLPGCSGAEFCPDACPIRSLWAKTRAEINAHLRHITVAKAAGLVHAANGSLGCCRTDGPPATC